MKHLSLSGLVIGKSSS